MTLKDGSPLEIVAGERLEKVKSNRRRRLEINKLKAACKAKNGVVLPETASSSEGEVVTCGSHGVVSVMGRRREMEDTTASAVGFREGYDFYGVFDGHGGGHVAEACRDHMGRIVGKEMDTWRRGREGDVAGDVEGDVKWWEGVMGGSYERMDREVGEEEGGGEEMMVGTTAVTAVVGKEVVVVANCGDSRAVLCRNGVALPLSDDHKPDRPDELARIEAAGGRVINWNGHRVLGVLATSRSIGDHHLKPYITPRPEVTVCKRTDKDEFLILASDGLWDVITNDVACHVVRRCLSGRIRIKPPCSGVRETQNRAGVAAALLVELAMAKGSRDNISVIVVELKKCIRFTCS